MFNEILSNHQLKPDLFFCICEGIRQQFLMFSFRNLWLCHLIYLCFKVFRFHDLYCKSVVWVAFYDCLKDFILIILWNITIR